MVLQVLYENIQDKSKVLTNKRLKQLEVDEKGVTAITTDGSTYTGDILVGADGIHSAVRQEMWRIADKISPGYIPTSEHSGQQLNFLTLVNMTADCPSSCPL